MSVYVLKAHEPAIRDPDITRRDPDPDPLDRLKVSLHASVKEAQDAAQKSYEAAYGLNADPAEDEDEQHVLEWIGDDYANDGGWYEAEYGIVEFPGFEPSLTQPIVPVHVDVTLDERDGDRKVMFCIDQNTGIGEAKEHFGVALYDLIGEAEGATMP